MSELDAPASVSVRRLGREGQPVVIIDGFSNDPEAVLAAGAAGVYAANSPYYPGVRAPADARYLMDADDELGWALHTVFGFTDGARVTECNFSLVTTAPEALQPLQRIPHYDGVDPGRLALLHYVCAPDMGGTSFYRHRETGFETVDARRFPEYREALEAEARRDGPPPAGYTCGDTDQFERLDSVPAAWNRAILYRGITLHSGDIGPGFEFNPDPRAGRLTVNTFLEPRR